LNHPMHQCALAEGFGLPPGFEVSPVGDTPGRGEDRRIQEVRDRRDGWRLVREASWPEPPTGARIWAAPILGGEIHKKLAPGSEGDAGIALYRTLEWIGRNDGPGCVFRHMLVREATGESADLQWPEWADWDRQDLVFARYGRLYRLDAAAVRRLAPRDA